MGAAKPPPHSSRCPRDSVGKSWYVRKSRYGVEFYGIKFYGIKLYGIEFYGIERCGIKSYGA